VNIYLVGYRGTGKSSVAPLVARELGSPWRVAEMDAIIETRAGRSIAELFAIEQEAGFRQREQALLAELGAESGWVVSTGGGVVLSTANRALLRAGFTVWLTAHPALIEERLAGDASTRDRRPNLTASGGRAEIEAMLERRTPLYAEVAMLTLSTEASSPSVLAQKIVASFSDFRREGGAS
jgi:shikimate kinase